ncbi:MAG: class I SAM-dependent methyltransferase [Acidobacteriia bacterium]|nr:class I SAM-dependent methyltransferase [Terriglobia bacterium]
MVDSTQRFSGRVENYVKYRPPYPEAVLEALTADCGLTGASEIADVGSGTGILTELFLKHGNPVSAVEPNREMREAAEHLLRGYPRCRSIEGTAEATTLPARSVDFVASGQAFHWFDRAKAGEEFVRILRPGGWVVLIWNERLTTSTPFLLRYEELLLRHATDYEQVDHRRIDSAALSAFYGAAGFETRLFDNRQTFDHEGLKGRLLSSSYVPVEGHPRHEAMLAELSELFEAHQSESRVVFEYVTKLYYGRL